MITKEFFFFPLFLFDISFVASSLIFPVAVFFVLFCFSVDLVIGVGQSLKEGPLTVKFWNLTT